LFQGKDENVGDYKKRIKVDKKDGVGDEKGRVDLTPFCKTIPFKTYQPLSDKRVQSQSQTEP
jgi:hypothetical protein